MHITDQIRKLCQEVYGSEDGKFSYTDVVDWICIARMATMWPEWRDSSTHWMGLGTGSDPHKGFQKATANSGGKLDVDKAYTFVNVHGNLTDYDSDTSQLIENTFGRGVADYNSDGFKEKLETLMESQYISDVIGMVKRLDEDGVSASDYQYDDNANMGICTQRAVTYFNSEDQGDGKSSFYEIQRCINPVLHLLLKPTPRGIDSRQMYGKDAATAARKKDNTPKASPTAYMPKFVVDEFVATYEKGGNDTVSLREFATMLFENGYKLPRMIMKRRGIIAANLNVDHVIFHLKDLYPEVAEWKSDSEDDGIPWTDAIQKLAMQMIFKRPRSVQDAFSTPVAINVDDDYTELRAAFKAVGFEKKDEQDALIKATVAFDAREAIDDDDDLSGDIGDGSLSDIEFWLMCGPIVMLREKKA